MIFVWTAPAERSGDSAFKAAWRFASRRSPRRLPFLIGCLLFLAVNLIAQTTNTVPNATPILGDIPRFHLERSTNTLSDAEIEGRKLAKELTSTRPNESSENAGVLTIRNANGSKTNIDVIFQTTLQDNWGSIYMTKPVKYAYGPGDIPLVYLQVIHLNNSTNIYLFSDEMPKDPINRFQKTTEIMVPFANSDFWLCDLGLEFFHWPDQKIIKKEFSRGRGCMVLESTNPNPTNGYSKVDCWIDEETLGIVHAEAFDPKGKKLKEFDPKSFKKVNGQWQLQDMEIRNVETGSRTTIRFDLKSG